MNLNIQEVDLNFGWLPSENQEEPILCTDLVKLEKSAFLYKVYQDPKGIYFWINALALKWYITEAIEFLRVKTVKEIKDENSVYQKERKNDKTFVGIVNLDENIYESSESIFKYKFPRPSFSNLLNSSGFLLSEIDSFHQ